MQRYGTICFAHVHLRMLPADHWPHLHVPRPRRHVQGSVPLLVDRVGVEAQGHHAANNLGRQTRTPTYRMRVHTLHACVKFT